MSAGNKNTVTSTSYAEPGRYYVYNNGQVVGSGLASDDGSISVTVPYSASANYSISYTTSYSIPKPEHEIFQEALKEI